MESRFEILDAFVDGERVDAAALKRALAEADGRDYLVDAWLLREGVQEDMTIEAAMPPATNRPRAVRTWLFAAAVLVALAGGYAIGYRASGLWSPVTTPASPSNPATAASPPPAVRTTSFPVPVPTKVIQVDFGTAPAAGAGGE